MRKDNLYFRAFGEGCAILKYRVFVPLIIHISSQDKKNYITLSTVYYMMIQTFPYLLLHAYELHMDNYAFTQRRQ